MGLLTVLLAMALPFTTPAYEVKVDTDIPYGTAMGYYTHAPIGDKKSTFKLLFHSGIPKPVTLEMDIYTPVGDDAAAKRPLLLLMHGGSFFIGNKAEPGQKGWGEYFASLGYVAVSIDYRLGFHATKKEIRQAEYRALEDADAVREKLSGFVAGGFAQADDDPQAVGLLEMAKDIKEWRPKAKRGKKIYDDEAFVKSLSDQFARRHSLSVRQVAALKRVLAVYRDKIPEYESRMSGLGLAQENAARS